MINWLPRDTVFFDLFESLARHVVSCSEHLHHLTKSFPNIQSDIQRITEEEHHADEIAHQALERLDRTFITPFDREDIHTLVGELDTIVDNINALSKRLGMYHVKAMDPEFVKLAEVMVQAATKLAEAVAGLRRSFKLSQLKDMLIEVHRLENLADDIYLGAVGKLLDGSSDPIHVIKWREFYQLLEHAIDGCEDVGNILERIVVKNG
jgi:predicted phosphate transport protein (TIGR00153 family)